MSKMDWETGKGNTSCFSPCQNHPRSQEVLFSFLSQMAKTKCINKPHAVLIPWPAQGQVSPLMRIARLLHSRGFDITFVHTEFNYNRLVRSREPDRQRVCLILGMRQYPMEIHHLRILMQPKTWFWFVIR